MATAVYWSNATCQCGATMHAAPSGWVCMECDAKIRPYDSSWPRPKELDIGHECETDPDEDECEECNGTGMVECEYCDGDGFTVCEHCGSEVDCEHCDGEGQVKCPECRGVAV